MENSNEEPSKTSDTNNNVQPHIILLNNSIFGRVFESMFEIMTDKTANRVFVTLINDYCDDQELRGLLTKLSRDLHQFLQVMNNDVGAISVENLIRKKMGKYELSNAVTSIMAREITNMMCVPILSPLVFKCFHCLPDPQKTELFEAIIENWADIITDKDGNLALKKSLKHFPESLRNNLLEKISSQACLLSQHSHGNYTVQRLLRCSDPRYAGKIFESLRGHFVMLSMQNKGNYIVQECLLSGKEGMDIVLQELINSDKLVQIANNEFGNYVIIIALVKCKESPHFDTFWRKLNQDRHLLQDKYSNICAELQKLEQLDTVNSDNV